MRSNEKKAIGFSPKGDDYDAFMLEFLEKEVSAPGKPSQQPAGDEDEVDSMVSDFLREAATLEAETQATIETGSVVPNLAEAKLERTATVSPVQNGPRTGGGEISSPVATELSHRATGPIFAAAKPAQRGRGFILAAAFMFLLVVIGIGAYRYMAVNAAPGKDGKQPIPKVDTRPIDAAHASSHPAPVSKQEPHTSTPAPSSAPAPAPARAVAGGAAKAAPLRLESDRPVESAGQLIPDEKSDRPASTIAETAPAGPASSAPPAEQKVKEAEIIAATPEPGGPAPPDTQRLSAEPGPYPLALPPAVRAPDIPLKLAGSNRPAPLVSRGVTPSVPLSKSLPRYPAVAWQLRISGTVEVDAQVDERGLVVKAAAVEGPTLLRDAAVDAVKRWKFKPATLNGADVSSVARVSVVFRRD